MIGGGAFKSSAHSLRFKTEIIPVALFVCSETNSTMNVSPVSITGASRFVKCDHRDLIGSAISEAMLLQWSAGRRALTVPVLTCALEWID